MIRQCLVAFAAAFVERVQPRPAEPELARPKGRSRPASDGVIGLATGLQGRFCQSYGNFAYMAGLVTDEFASTTAALISISDAEQGSVPPGTGIAENVFNSIYRTVRTADELLAGSDALAGQFDAGTRSGLRALAFALKAESLGEALQSYQTTPDQDVRRHRADVRATRRGACRMSARCSTPPPTRSRRRHRARSSTTAS